MTPSYYTKISRRGIKLPRSCEKINRNENKFISSWRKKYVPMTFPKRWYFRCCATTNGRTYVFYNIFFVRDDNAFVCICVSAYARRWTIDACKYATICNIRIFIFYFYLNFFLCTIYDLKNFFQRWSIFHYLQSIDKLHVIKHMQNITWSIIHYYSHKRLIVRRITSRYEKSFCIDHIWVFISIN